MPPFYGQQTKQPQQPAPQSYQPWQMDSYNQRMGQEAQARYGYMGQDSQARHGAQAASDQAKYGYLGQEAQARYGYQGQAAQANAQTQAAKFGAQANKDMSAFDALKGLGISGQQAMSNYGIGQQNALLNSQIAQNNFAGQMGTNYYNTLGQGMNALSGMNAAASQATADSNKAEALRGLGAGVVNTGLYASQAGAYTAGNIPAFNFGGLGGYGGGPQVQGSPDRQFNAPPPPPYMQGGGTSYNPAQPLQKSLPVLQDMLRQMDNPNGMPNLLRQDANRAFNQTQANLMDPGIRDSLNGQMALGYGMINGMYDKSNYGLNTRDGVGNSRPRYLGGRYGTSFGY